MTSSGSSHTSATAALAAPNPTHSQRLKVTLPSGPLGTSILRRSDGEGVITKSSNNLLREGDVIWSLNGIRLSTVEGAPAAWTTLFDAFGRAGTRNLVVLRPARKASASPVEQKAEASAAVKVTPHISCPPSTTTNPLSAVDIVANIAAAAASPKASIKTISPASINPVAARGNMQKPVQVNVAGIKHGLSGSGPTNKDAPPHQKQEEPTRKKPRPATGTSSNRDIESLVASAPLASVQAALVNVWVAATDIGSGITMRSTKALDDFLTLYDTTSCCFKCQRRFRHGTEHLEVLSSGDVSICSSCENRNTKYTLTEVVDCFGISKGDAKQLRHSTGISGWGGIKYSFAHHTIIDAIRYDYSLQRKVRKAAFLVNYFRLTKDRFEEAKTADDKSKILTKVATNISEVKLREFTVRSLQKVPKGQVGGFLANL